MQLKIVRDVGTYLLLEKQADVALRAAEAFRELASDLGNGAAHVRRLAELEHEGDEHTHRLQDDVAAHFITPLDKEDLRLLSQALDDITDAIEAVGARMEIYHITEARPDLLPLADQVVTGTECVAAAIAEMKSGFHTERLHEKLQSIHSIENQSDELFRRALSQLFSEQGADPIFVMKWKEIYDRIEVTMDICENVAKILGTISVKYA